jgi:hypothetical protein
MLVRVIAGLISVDDVLDVTRACVFTMSCNQRMVVSGGDIKWFIQARP